MKTTLSKMAATAAASSFALLIPAGIAQAQTRPEPLSQVLSVCENFDYISTCTGSAVSREPNRVYAHITAQQAGYMYLSETTVCGGVTESDEYLTALEGSTGPYTSAVYVIPSVADHGKDCTISIQTSADLAGIIVGDGLGNVRAWLSTTR
jgi:hypothetical protein